MSAENARLVTGIFENFRRETWESGDWIAGFDPDVVYHPREDEPDTQPFVGRDRWVQIVGGFMDAFAEITFTVEEAHDAGDWAVVSTVMHASGGASGLDVEDRYVFAYRMHDRRVVEGWEHHTMDEALTALRERTGGPEASAATEP